MFCTSSLYVGNVGSRVLEQLIYIYRFDFSGCLCFTYLEDRVVVGVWRRIGMVENERRGSGIPRCMLKGSLTAIGKTSKFPQINIAYAQC